MPKEINEICLTQNIGKMAKGKIGVTSENIFPIIKKFLYSEHEIFLRELISNAIDATQKLKALSSIGEFKGELGDLTVRVSVDKENKTITVSDQGIGMTSEEIDKYINQIAFSGANDFLDKYKDKIDAIIGHFGLGFYSSFMVSKKVEIVTKSYQDGAKAVKWSCDGNPEFELSEIDKENRGTDIILHLDNESEEFLEDSKINELLKKYCKFLPVEIAFGKEKDYKDGKQVDTDKDIIINNTKPAWTKKPADLKDEDYKSFYKELYPLSYEEPLFNIHLNVDYPFNLTGILYFPKIKNQVEIQKNKIQLYSNQVFVTDSVEGIVPEFLTLLHGVLDSPDIPLNVSRSYLQSDSNVKKISSHINKKVADKLKEIFKKDRTEFEKKWDYLKIFVQYGMLSEEKFYDRAKDYFLFKNTEDKYFTIEEYKKLIEANQTNKDKKVVHLYSTNKEEQYSFIDAAKNKGYDVLLMDGQLDAHFIQHIETKLPDVSFARVDSDVVDKLIQTEDGHESNLTLEQERELRPVFKSQLPSQDNYMIMFESMTDKDLPAIITQSEFIRRMKDMSQLGPQASMYGALPDSYNLVLNANHPLILKIQDAKNEKIGEEVSKLTAEIEPFVKEKEALEKEQQDKKEEEVTQEEKDKVEDLDKKIKELSDKKEEILSNYGKDNKLVKQIIDLALLSNNMLKGEDLTKFVKRSVELIEV